MAAERMIKLHVGCGKRDFGPDWIHIDGSGADSGSEGRDQNGDQRIKDGSFAHIKHHDIVNLQKYFAPGSVDLIYCSHTLETQKCGLMDPYQPTLMWDLQLALWSFRSQRARGAAIPGGRCRANNVSPGLIAYADEGAHEVKDVLGKWFRVLKPDTGVLRLAVPDFGACAKLYAEKGVPLSYFVLNAAGFDRVEPWDWRQTEHAHHDDYSQAYYPHMEKETGTLISLNLEARRSA
eukprot:g16750.t1